MPYALMCVLAQQQTAEDLVRLSSTEGGVTSATCKQTAEDVNHRFGRSVSIGRGAKCEGAI